MSGQMWGMRGVQPDCPGTAPDPRDRAAAPWQRPVDGGRRGPARLEHEQAVPAGERPVPDHHRRPGGHARRVRGPLPAARCAHPARPGRPQARLVDPYSDVFTGSYIAMEAEAAKVRINAHLVPGIFQTPGYAHEMIRRTRPAISAGDAERRVTARTARQDALFSRDDPPGHGASPAAAPEATTASRSPRPE